MTGQLYEQHLPVRRRVQYWLMTHWGDLEPGGNYVINRARLYRDRRDFVIQPGDAGMPEDYPSNPAR